MPLTTYKAPDKGIILSKENQGVSKGFDFFA